MATKKGRILTGHRPTGPRHIGHLMGTLETWARLQDSYECYFLVADLHVLTTDFEHPQRVRENTLGIVLDWLAAGIDPARADAGAAVGGAGAYPVEHAAGHAGDRFTAKPGANVSKNRSKSCTYSPPWACSVTRCCRPRISSSTKPTACRWAKISCRTSS